MKLKTKILVISGSRNKQGKTAEAIEAVRKGVAKAGGTSECIFLLDLKLERCRQCDSDGWGICRKEHRCIIEDDDFASVVKKIESSDVVVFANPVYFGDLTESMRTFLERFSRIRFVPKFLPVQPIPGPAAIGLCYSGGSGHGSPLCAAILYRLLELCRFDIVDMFPLRRQNLELKLPMLETIGQWLVTKPTSGPPLVPQPS
jgi:multimeric flavodoxin WrbA